LDLALCGLLQRYKIMYKLIKNTLIDPIIQQGCLTTVGFMWFMAAIEIAFFAALAFALFI